MSETEKPMSDWQLWKEIRDLKSRLAAAEAEADRWKMRATAAETELALARESPDPFEWLAQCLDCGRVHEKREIALSSKDFSPWLKIRWEDPEDGHVYKPRMWTKDVADQQRRFYEENMQ